MAMTQQEVIKKFMASLDTTKKSGIEALDEAINAATGGKVKTTEALISQMSSDCAKAINANDFLQNYCGINLDNTDTGAITGLDAGGKTTKTAESVVPESGSWKYPTGNSFTKRGLKFILPNTIKDDSVGSAKDKKFIIGAIYSWWAEEGLKLNENSYGLSFYDNDVSAKEIYIQFFYNNADAADLATTYWYDGYEYGAYDGKVDKIELKINMAKYYNFDSSDKNGISPHGAGYLDRTLAHELTHAIMNSQIDYSYDLPNFIFEGMAELTHGIDDERSNRIIALASNSDRLKSALNLNNTKNATSDEYAGGYMFLRYFAKQFSTDSNSGLNFTNFTKNTVISGTGNSDTIKNIAGGVTIKGGAGADSIYSSTEKNYTVKSAYGYVTIDGGSGNDTIYNNDPYVSILGGIGNDSIYSKSSTVTIRGGAGADSVTNYSRYAQIYGDADGDNIENRAGGAKIYGGAGNDFINSTTDSTWTINSSYGYVTIDGGAGNDTIANNDPYVSINGGADNDRISVGSYANVTVAGGTGNDIIYGNRNNYGVVYLYSSGDGNDTIYNFHDVDTLKISGTSTTVKSGSDTKINVGNGSILLKNYSTTVNSNEINLTSGKDNFSNTSSGKKIYGLAGNDNIKNTASNVTISGGAGNDSIQNQNRNVLIYGDNDNDSILNTSSNVTIYGGVGADTIDNQSASSTTTIRGGDGNDFIKNNGTSIWIYGDSGNDKISLGSYSKNVTISAGTGNDTIYNSNSNGVKYLYTKGDGNDVINGWTAKDTLSISGAAYKLSTVGNNVKVSIAGGNYITLVGAKGKTLNIKGTTATTTTSSIISNTKASASVKGTSSADTIKNTANKATIYGYAGNDSIFSSSSSVKVYAGDGNDTISVSGGSSLYLDGGAGTDKISLAGSGTKNTIYGGKGNDTIYSKNTNGVMYLYAKGDGNDVINGWTAKDTLSISGGSYKLSTVGNNVKVSIAGGNFVTLVGAKGKKINIKSSSTSSQLAQSADMVEQFWFDDNNFVSNETQIDSITEISSTNYSVGKLDDAIQLGKLTNDTLSSIYSYSDEK